MNFKLYVFFLVGSYVFTTILLPEIENTEVSAVVEVSVSYNSYYKVSGQVP